MSELAFLTVAETARGLRERTFSALELVEANATQIERWNPSHSVFTVTTVEEARERARQLDAEAARGVFRGPLHGLTVAVKDLIDVAGHPNSAGTGARRHADPAVSHAPAVQALTDAGANVIGLANLHEWAYGGSSSNPFFGSVRNIWDEDRIPGGSSGGSAVAVAAGMASFALGTDTGGSVRIPASLTGISSLKVTVGSVPTRGVMPLSWTLDTVGPMARRAEDLVLPYAALRGGAAHTGAAHTGAAERPRPDLRRLVVGIDRDYYLQRGRVDPDVYAVFTGVLADLEAVGARVVDVSIPLLRESSPAQYALVLAEASAVHSGHHRAERAGYGEDVQALLALGDTVLAGDYLAALRFRTELWAQMRGVFEEVDVLLSPTTPHAATLIGQDEVVWPDGSSESFLDACWRFTYPSNLVGVPSTSQPCGLTSTGLPVGLQVIGRPGSEPFLLDLAGTMERTFGWDFRAPATL